MAAGIKYDLNPLEVERELWNQKTSFRLAGGVNLVIDNLVPGSFLPVLTPLAVDFTTRKATAVKNVKIVEDAAADATEYKIQKGSLAYVGMFIGTGSKGAAISAINKTNGDYDVITVAATIGAVVHIGDVLFEASAAGGTTVKNKANFLNFARAKVEQGASVTLLGQAYEIKEAELYVPISSKDKETLTSRFMFI